VLSYEFFVSIAHTVFLAKELFTSLIILPEFINIKNNNFKFSKIQVILVLKIICATTTKNT